MEIKNSKFGRGVFATKPYGAGDTIEVSPVIILNTKDTKKINDTSLYDYYYSWGNKNSQAAIALGFGSLFNHSYDPNAKYIKKQANNTIQFFAVRPINQGDEILINYNGNPESKEPLWFKADTLD